MEVGNCVKQLSYNLGSVGLRKFDSSVHHLDVQGKPFTNFGHNCQADFVFERIDELQDVRMVKFAEHVLLVTRPCLCLFIP